jgi:hypothetical protein
MRDLFATLGDREPCSPYRIPTLPAVPNAFHICRNGAAKISNADRHVSAGWISTEAVEHT